MSARDATAPGTAFSSPLCESHMAMLRGATGTKPASSLSLVARQECGIAAGRCGIDGHGLLGGEAREIMRPASLGAGAGEAVAAERLHADHRADHVAVDIDVARLQPRDDGLHHVVDAGLDAE